MAILAAGVAVGNIDDAIPGFAAVFAFIQTFFGLAWLLPGGLRVDEDVIGIFGIDGDGAGAQGVEADVFAGFPGEAGVFGSPDADDVHRQINSLVIAARSFDGVEALAAFDAF